MAATDVEIKASSTRTPFQKAFFVANVMEIFERLSWYGFFTVASLYMTSPTAQGGLGFSDQQRGVLQGIIPFLLYVFPVFTGALGDRYGYRKMFLLAFAIMTPSYYLLGQVHSFWAFFMVFLSVAVGAAIFKPLVVGTISRTTDDTNRGLGFGIFYMMVNVGGFAGPLIAGTVRKDLGWDWVFIFAAIWIAVNFIPALFFFKDPSKDPKVQNNKRFKDVLLDMQQVIGNGRFALTVIPILIILMLAGGAWILWSTAGFAILAWLLINFIWNLSAPGGNAPWYGQKTKIGNSQFMLYILIMAGFWTIYQQIFYTLPLYIRDYVDTGNIISFFHSVSPGFASWLAHVKLDELTSVITTLHTEYGSSISPEMAREIFLKLTNYSVMVPQNEIIGSFQTLTASSETNAPAILAAQWAEQYKQINPEYIMSLNFLSILLFQIMISLIAEKYKAIIILIVGTLLVGLSYALTGISHMVEIGGIVVILCVVGFSFGEMFASPKSQDYVAGIMPKSKAAMFMGYYFVSMALGFLFGGLLSGWGYDYFANTLNKPELMWLTFGIIGAAVAIGLLLFNKFVAPDLEAQRQLHH